MTIKPNENMPKAHTELVRFMNEFAITHSLAIKLLNCNQYTISRHRMGRSNFNKEKLKTLKLNFKAYMQKKLDGIKV